MAAQASAPHPPAAKPKPEIKIEQMIACLESQAALLIDRNDTLAKAGWPTRPDDFEMEQAEIFAAAAKFLRRVSEHRDQVRDILEGGR